MSEPPTTPPDLDAAAASFLAALDDAEAYWTARQVELAGQLGEAEDELRGIADRRAAALGRPKRGRPRGTTSRPSGPSSARAQENKNRALAFARSQENGGGITGAMLAEHLNAPVTAAGPILGGLVRDGALRRETDASGKNPTYHVVGGDR